MRFSISEAFTGYFVKHFASAPRAAPRPGRPDLERQPLGRPHARRGGSGRSRARGDGARPPRAQGRRRGLVALRGPGLRRAQGHAGRRRRTCAGTTSSASTTASPTRPGASGWTRTPRGRTSSCAATASSPPSTPPSAAWASPPFRASSPRASRVLRRLTPRVLGGRDIFLVVHPDLARVARVRAVMDFVVELFARDAELWSGVPQQANPVAIA